MKIGEVQKGWTFLENNKFQFIEEGDNFREEEGEHDNNEGVSNNFFMNKGGRMYKMILSWEQQICVLALKREKTLKRRRGRLTEGTKGLHRQPYINSKWGSLHTIEHFVDACVSKLLLMIFRRKYKKVRFIKWRNLGCF